MLLSVAPNLIFIIHVVISNSFVFLPVSGTTGLVLLYCFSMMSVTFFWSFVNSVCLSSHVVESITSFQTFSVVFVLLFLQQHGKLDKTFYHFNTMATPNYTIKNFKLFNGILLYPEEGSIAKMNECTLSGKTLAV